MITGGSVALRRKNQKTTFQEVISRRKPLRLRRIGRLIGSRVIETYPKD
jgi:hypothetical protein